MFVNTATMPEPYRINVEASYGAATLLPKPRAGADAITSQFERSTNGAALEVPRNRPDETCHVVPIRTTVKRREVS